MECFDGSGIGSHMFDNYRDDMRVKRLAAQSPSQKKKTISEDRERRRHTFWHSHVLIDPHLFIMLMISVTHGYGDEKEEMRRALSTAKGFWPMNGHYIAADAGLNDVAVRNAITRVGALPFVKWTGNAVNAINPDRYDEAEDPDIIELTFFLAKTFPANWLQLYAPRWKSETLFSAIQRKYGGFARSLSLEGATTQITSKYVCNTIERLAYFWRIMKLDGKCFGTTFQLGGGEDEEA